MVTCNWEPVVKLKVDATVYSVGFGAFPLKHVSGKEVDFLKKPHVK